ncbi:MAG TPA: hypothetical protein VHB21_24880 [Minicystis sp.]|nr:hypothetical protein [Minicystis sp.]
MSSTARVRAFEPGDLIEVADLWQRSFGKRGAPASPAVRAHFRAIFFESPWRDPELPSWVHEDRGGRIVGFFGVVPRPMRLGARRIRAAVATQLFVDPDARDGFVALTLMRTFFAGPQDLSFTDGANASAQRIWQRCGGDVLPLQSLEWTRVLRPLGHYAGRLGRSARLARGAGALRVLGAAVDEPLGRSLRGVFGPPRQPDDVRDEPATVEALLACIDEAQPGQALRPVYDPRSLGWVLATAASARSLGDLDVRLVRAPCGGVLGAYVVFVLPKGPANVLMIHARPHGAVSVVRALLRRAWERGAVAVRGAMDPRYITELAAEHCTFACPGFGFLARSRDAGVLDALHRGRAELSRLDGEWWVPLGIDRRRLLADDPAPACARHADAGAPGF